MTTETTTYQLCRPHPYWGFVAVSRHATLALAEKAMRAAQRRQPAGGWFVREVVR